MTDLVGYSRLVATYGAMTLAQLDGRFGVQTLFIEAGSPRENGCSESFNGKLRDELLNTEIFGMLREAQVLVEGWWRQWRRDFAAPSGRSLIFSFQIISL